MIEKKNLLQAVQDLLDMEEELLCLCQRQAGSIIFFRYFPAGPPRRPRRAGSILRPVAAAPAGPAKSYGKHLSGGRMFTKADYLNYLELLAEKERDMMFGLHSLLDQVSDEPVAGQLRALLREKQEAYEAVSRLFGNLFGLAAEQRRYKREPALGEAKLRNLETGEMTTCRCLDISMGGLCVQLRPNCRRGCCWPWKSGFLNRAGPLCAGPRSGGATGLKTAGTGRGFSSKRPRRRIQAKPSAMTANAHPAAQKQ